MSAGTEMTRYLAGWAKLARRQRQYAELLGVEAAQDIHAEEVAHQQALVRSAHAAESDDREAFRLLEQAVLDGLTEADRPAIDAAMRCIKRSAERDHDISEAL